MKKYQVRILPTIDLQHFSPTLKKSIRSALDELSLNPYLGKELRSPLTGLRSYRVARFRIIYKIVLKKIEIEVIEIEERKIVYEKVTKALSLH